MIRKIIDKSRTVGNKGRSAIFFSMINASATHMRNRSKVKKTCASPRPLAFIGKNFVIDKYTNEKLFKRKKTNIELCY